MVRYYSIAVAAGLASGLLQAAAVLPGPGAMLLAYIAPLPLFLAGFGMGLQGAAIAILVQTLISLIFAGWTFAAVQIAVYGVPIMVLTRQALLSRSDAQGGTVWYPPGLLLMWLAGMAGVALALAVIGLGMFSDGLLAQINAMMEPFAAQFPNPDQREMLLSLAAFMPAFFAASWMLGMVINGVLAQGLLVRFGQNLRPSPRMADIHLPVSWLGFMAVALFLATLDGLLGVCGKTLAAIAIVPYFLLGLGVIHGYVQPWAARWIVLILLYILMILWFVPVIITVVGLVFALMRLRGGNTVSSGDNAEREE